MAKKISQKILSYTVIFEPAEEGGFVATVPALAGCATQGDTFEEAIEMVKDAIQGYIEVQSYFNSSQAWFCEDATNR